jgi:type IV secretion system protein TrbI
VRASDQILRNSSFWTYHRQHGNNRGWTDNFWLSVARILCRGLCWDMSEQTNSQTLQTEPELIKNISDPRGVFQKNAKPMMYLGVAFLVILAAVFSSWSKPTATKASAAHSQPPQPMVQDNTDNNIQDLKNQLATERQHEAEQAELQRAVADAGMSITTPAQKVAAATYSANGQPAPCLPGQPYLQQPTYGYAQQPGAQGQSSPAQQASQQIRSQRS